MNTDIIIIDTVEINGVKMVPLATVKLLIADLQRKFDSENARVTIYESSQAKNVDTT
jgi:hypothetical protein